MRIGMIFHPSAGQLAPIANMVAGSDYEYLYETEFLAVFANASAERIYRQCHNTPVFRDNRSRHVLCSVAEEN